MRVKITKKLLRELCREPLPGQGLKVLGFWCNWGRHSRTRYESGRAGAIAYRRSFSLTARTRGVSVRGVYLISQIDRRFELLKVGVRV
jgi:hypothetical protein